MNDAERARFDVLRKPARFVQYGGSCYSYSVLASGRTDLAFDARLDFFDVQEPAAVIQGAGGYDCCDAGQYPERTILKEAIDVRFR